jgi:hypothetical protein
MKIASENELDKYIDQHDVMLQFCSKIADLEIPAILQMLMEIDAALGESCADSEHMQFRHSLDDDLAITRLALAIHIEVNRRSLMSESAQSNQIQ